ncbi:DUF692 domain-containing protein [Actinokineospora enzanensis]|uniref:DUF692 domain-containing protein n=1 Tax=Actinokineospora enzanensis TaxID=155975 RepID=UPI0003621951|nr:DUF692 family multinuclear iron-containing protein [Actinokineospora enzanensis]
MDKPDPIGVGIQYNPEILDWFPFESLDVDLFEVLLDPFMGPLDGPSVFLPGALERLRELRRKRPLLAHSNYGCDFGFGDLERTPAVLRHVPMARAIGSPWIADHSFYGDESWLDIWSSPVQFSPTEVRRIADRARRLQEHYGIPLAHENAAYYLATPGSTMREADFMAALVERSGTFLHLDLHNVYANSLNLAGFDPMAYLETIPLDRVIAVHLAGGSWHDGLYHDWHDNPVPEPVWELLDWLLARARPGAVILEYQGRCHHESTRLLDTDDESMIVRDLARAKAAWAAASVHWAGVS